MSTSRRIGVPVLVVFVLAGVMGSPAAGSDQQDPCRDPAHEDYPTYECKVARLRDRSFVVVAVPDGGINPYHVDFRLPPDDDMRDVPPWEYISGYPRTAEALELTLDAASYDEAVQQDSETWDDVEPGEFYFIPGTKIVGAYADPETWWRQGPTPILDDRGHGTGSASVAAGRIHGSAPDAEVLIVAIKRGGSDHAVSWSGAQPWIDVISASIAYFANASSPTDTVTYDEITRAAVESGKVVVASAGNGVSGCQTPPSGATAR